MIGKLQSNKAKKAVEIFDYIHSLDSQKLADNLSKFQTAINKSINYFIQVNIGNESHKNQEFLLTKSMSFTIIVSKKRI